MHSATHGLHDEGAEQPSSEAALENRPLSEAMPWDGRALTALACSVKRLPVAAWYPAAENAACPVMRADAAGRCRAADLQDRSVTAWALTLQAHPVTPHLPDLLLLADCSSVGYPPVQSGCPWHAGALEKASADPDSADSQFPICQNLLPMNAQRPDCKALHQSAAAAKTPEISSQKHCPVHKPPGGNPVLYPLASALQGCGWCEVPEKCRLSAVKVWKKQIAGCML